MVILAAVSINAAFNTGIIDTAVNGAVNYAEAQRQEQVTFDELDGSLQDILNRINEYDIGGTVPTESPDKPTLPDGWDGDKVDLVTSADNIDVPVPKGFVASKASGENTVENGFVIYQGAEDVTDENLDTAMRTRNQFVWVPVADTSNMFWTYNGKDVGQLYSFDTSSRTYSKITTFDTNSVREPDIVTGNGLQYDAVTSNYASLGLTNKNGEAVTTVDQFRVLIEEDFSDMKESIEKYHGFYIGRYEIGVGEKVVKGVNPLGSKTWYEHYKINKNMINLNGIKSNMIWGSQWDQTMIWFDTQGGVKKDYVYDSTGKGHYSGNGGSVTTTGSDRAYAVNNIYDMSGNAWDWTLEVGMTSGRDLRGDVYDGYSSIRSASNRYYGGFPTDSISYGISSRSILVI